MNPNFHVNKTKAILVGLVIMIGVCTVVQAAEVSVPKKHEKNHPNPPSVERNRAEVEAALAKAPRVNKEELKPLNVMLLADVKDHLKDIHAHNYPLWQKRWELLFGGSKCSDEQQANLYGPALGDGAKQQGATNVNVITAWDWPTKKQFKKADVILAFCYIEWHEKEYTDLKRYIEEGGGLVVIHAACWTRPKWPYASGAAELLGMDAFNKFRHGEVNLKITNPEHPFCIGLPTEICFHDETYWRLNPTMDGMEVLATSDEIIDAEGNKASQPVIWTHTYGKGRVVGNILGHFTWTFDDPYFRMLLLRGTAWAAGESPYRFDELVLRDASVTN